MSEEKQHLYAPNLLSVCIDRAEEGDYSGLAWDQYHMEPVPFNTMMDLIRHVESFFDEIGFPQRSTVPRSFDGTEPDKAGRRSVFHQNRNIEKVMSMDELEEKRGDQGTFIVQIKYRQNATWQGQVIWAEQNKKMYFRSALELLHLIDTAINEGNDSAEGEKSDKKDDSVEENSSAERNGSAERHDADSSGRYNGSEGKDEPEA